MSDITYELIKKSLDASSLRQAVISHNIANINTKGFKRSEVSFEDQLKNKISSMGTDENYIKSIEPKVITDNSSSMRMDGNNVDIDYEMSNMAANNILYNGLISQINTKIGIMRYVINEGRG